MFLSDICLRKGVCVEEEAKGGEVSPLTVSCPGRLLGNTHLRIFFHSKGTQMYGRRVLQLPFGADIRPGHLEGIRPAPFLPPVRLLSLLHLQGSPWERGPPPSAAASAPAPPCWICRAPPGPCEPFLAQPPPKPGEVESCCRCSLRGPHGAALGMLSRRCQCCSK